jgi:hypothetical protein
MTAIERAAGLQEGEDWARGEGPDEHVVLNARYEARCDALLAEVCREYGEAEIADLLVNDPAEFRRRWEAGDRWWRDSGP